MDNKQAMERLRYKLNAQEAGQRYNIKNNNVLTVDITEDEIELLQHEIKALEENDNLKAEIEKLKENSVQLPCKVGDTLYYIDKKQGLTEFEVYSITVKEEAENYGKFVRKKIGVIVGKLLHEFDFYDIGRTVFLTREEAEKALKEREVE